MRGNNIKAALTKKYGPAPAWAWLLIFGLGVWYYRRKFGSVTGTSTTSGTGTGSVTPGPGPDPGTGSQVLQPGESVYDPTAGVLATAPGGGSGGASGGGTGADGVAASGDPAQFANAIDDLANAIAAGMPAEQVNVTGGDPTPQGGHKKSKAPKLKGRGAIRAPFGHTKPAAPKGYKAVGQGHGFWEFVPKAVAKSKGQHRSTKNVAKHTPTGAKSTSRSGAAVRKGAGGRTTQRAPARAPGTTNSHTSSAPTTPSRARQRPKTPPVTTVVRQRPVTTHPKPAQKQPAAPAPRPSAPAPRTQRAPAPPPSKAKAAPRKRK